MNRYLFRSAWDEERARELDAHLAIEIDENIARGMTPEDARSAARRKLGNTARIREDIYRFNTIGVVDTVWRDVRYAIRVLSLNPGFALVAVVSLALGIGANTAIFQVLNAVRLRALPVTHPEQLVEIRLDNDDDRFSGPTGAFSGDRPNLTNPLWERIRDRQQAFSSAFAWGSTSFEQSTGGESREAAGLWVSGEFFTTLDVRPVIGRAIAAADDRRGCASPPAVISYGFWQREFGGQTSVLGRRLTLDGHAYEIVGVTPQTFFGVDVGRAYDVAIPLCAEPFSRTPSALDRKDGWFLAAIGRLKTGWTPERATAHLHAISPPIFQETLPNYRPQDEKAYLGFLLGAFPAHTGVSSLRGPYTSPLWLLLAMTTLVLLIACANLANLMLARATAREREIAVRLAIGASRLRIVGQLLTESLLIAAAGACLGALVASRLSHLLVASLTTESDRVFVDVTGDWRVFAFVTVVALGTCVLFGLVPAVRATATQPAAAMKAGSRGSTDSHERFGLRRALVVAQVALSLMLIVGALLFGRSLRNLMTLDAGFRQDNLLIAALDFRRTAATDARRRAEFDSLLAELRRQPSVDEAARVRIVPVSGSFSNRTIVIDGVPRKENVNMNTVGDRYFATVQAPLLAGRDFDARDTAGSPRVAIVTESFARLFFGGVNPVGRTFQIEEAPGQPRPPYAIVGFARDSKYGDLHDPFEPLMYIAAAQDDRPQSSFRVLIRSASLAAAATAVNTAALSTNPSIVVRVQTMASQVKDSLLRDRLIALLSGLFGALAAFIAVIGLYGVMSYTVARRRNEIGIRLALGAESNDVVRMVMREAATLLAIGVAIGSVCSLAAGRAAAALLFGLQPHDPVALGLAVAVLSTVAVVASYVPALRASRLEPTVALRDE